MSLDHLEGDLSQTRLPRVLLAIAAQDGSGILTVQGAEDIVAVSFVQGAIVTADALNQTVEDGLGKVLQGRGLLSSDQFSAAVREHQGGGSGSLGDLLVGKGLISREQLLEALRLQTFRAMLQLLTWGEGDFKFYAGDEVSFEEGFRPITVEELLLRAVDKLGDRAGLPGPVPALESVFRAVPPRGPVQVFGRDGDGLDAGIWLDERQAAFLSRVDGRSPGADIARTMGLSKGQALHTLYRLSRLDLVETTGKGSRAGDAPVTDSSPGRPAPPPGDVIPFADPSPASPPSDTIPFGEASSSSIPAPQPAADPFADGPSRGPAPAPRPSAPRPAPQPSPTSTPLPTPEPASQPATVSGAIILEWIGPVLAAALCLGTFLLLFGRPVSLLLPFPWQDTARSTAERQIRQSLFQRIDRSARTYFLMEAHYPDELSELRGLGLISGVDLSDPAGYALDYSTDQVSYRIRLSTGEETVEGLGTTEAITGDFLVDPQFLGSAATAQAPLVLLD
ncbi:MAG: DUF4388 domain-containing protein [Acidobacteriota bacterium]